MSDPDNPTQGREPKDLGELHALLTRGLPVFVGDKGVLDVRALAEEMGISYQAVYHMFTRKSISKKRIVSVCNLSKATPDDVRNNLTMEVDGKRVNWEPLEFNDFAFLMG